MKTATVIFIYYNKKERKVETLNEKIIKPCVIRKITDQIKPKYPLLKAEAVNDILSAFFNVITASIEKGDSVILNGYMTILPQYRAKRKARNIAKNSEVIVPEHYKVILKAGTNLKEAAKKLTQKQIGGKNE